ncbi:MAG: 30S ribosomal protein S1 [Candidatus Cloacimonetes bacterium]|nr:30S ribosomal protein S1 [Candidatus Cloacimonadota bacterium]MCF7814431.1 30S ribosomal protein S1 [Candidatus Cloacimonadota bacterium]MCF7869007.1 30S ribosomal protein S1 [Candidatus Cloacimonadota bacterium]MCF7884415.1 30S ribosomal protein S1 [Candidatus Cloacimonadota bacterium]
MIVNDQKEIKDEKNPKKEVLVETKKEEVKEEIKQPETEAKEETKEVKTEEKKEEQPAELAEEKVEKPAEKTEETEKPAEVTEEKVEEVKTEKPKELSKKKKDEMDMMSLLDEHFSKFDAGKIVEGTVVSVDERSVLVDIGFKSESAISIREFTNSTLPEIGSKIKVYIDSVEDGSGRLKLSKKKADFYLNLEELEKVHDKNESVKGILRRRVKGGMIVEIDGLEAFLPGSQISTKPIPNLDQFIGKESDFKILKIDKERRNIIVSRKKVLIEEQEEKLQELRKVIVEGAELDGEVRNITDYGAFIDLGGIDGLLHITDMSWGHIKHPSDMLNIGDKVKVKVLNYDVDEGKVSLGLKQLVPHPWENIETKYPEGTIVSGKVVNITNYGVFVELESGVEGLVHISEMSWTKKIKHPKQILKLGDSIKAIVLHTSKEEKRISLGIKQMEPNPWLTIEERYPIGSVLKGTIKSITPFGVFVEIEKDIEGLIHISDISWTKRIYHPKEVYKKGQEVKVVVISIDKTLHRIALGVKQLTEDPWDKLDEKLPINTELKAKIVKLISKGVLVDVGVDGNMVEGFVPLSHLAIPGLKKAGMAFEVSEELPLKIIELDLENRRLILSVKAYYFAKDAEELQKYVDEHQQKVREKIEKRRAIKENLVEQEEEPKPAEETKEEPVENSKKEQVVEKAEVKPEEEKPEEKETEKEESTEEQPEEKPEEEKPEEKETEKEESTEEQPEEKPEAEEKKEEKPAEEKAKEETPEEETTDEEPEEEKQEEEK